LIIVKFRNKDTKHPAANSKWSTVYRYIFNGKFTM